jgi:hypothetical protein
VLDVGANKEDQTAYEYAREDGYALVHVSSAHALRDRRGKVRSIR